jgi:hypothetical protein
MRNLEIVAKHDAAFSRTIDIVQIDETRLGLVGSLPPFNRVHARVTACVPPNKAFGWTVAGLQNPPEWPCEPAHAAALFRPAFNYSSGFAALSCGCSGRT